MSRILILVCCSLTGCAVMDSVGLWRGRQFHELNGRRESTRDVSLDHLQLDEELARADRELQVKLLLRASPGSYVGVSDAPGHTFIGILLRADQTKIELQNCVLQEVVPGPDGQLQAKRIHVHFRSLKTSSMTDFAVISPPSRGFVPSEHDSRDFNVETLVFRNGRRQRWVEPPESTANDHDADSVEKLKEQIAGTPCGSQVSIVDESGQRLNAILFAAGSDVVKLMNCVSRDIIPGPGSQEQIQTSHVPFQSLRTESLRGFAIVSAPPPDFAVPIGYGFEDYYIAEFISTTGRRQRWGPPRK